MDKIKLLTWSVIGLLLLNLSTIGFLFFNSNERNQPKPKEIVIEKLHFDKQQQEKYQVFIDENRLKINAFDDGIRNLKNQLFLELKQEKINTNKSDSLINQIANIQKEIEKLHFKHFQDIKSICRKDQLPYFNELTEDLGKIFSNQRRPPRGPEGQGPPRRE